MLYIVQVNGNVNGASATLEGAKKLCDTILDGHPAQRPRVLNWKYEKWGDDKYWRADTEGSYIEVSSDRGFFEHGGKYIILMIELDTVYYLNI